MKIRIELSNRCERRNMPLDLPNVLFYFSFSLHYFLFFSFSLFFSLTGIYFEALEVKVSHYLLMLHLEVLFVFRTCSWSLWRGKGQGPHCLKMALFERNNENLETHREAKLSFHSNVLAKQIVMLVQKFLSVAFV